jgi:hypothetical protein
MGEQHTFPANGRVVTHGVARRASRSSLRPVTESDWFVTVRGVMTDEARGAIGGAGFTITGG